MPRCGSGLLALRARCCPQASPEGCLQVYGEEDRIQQSFMAPTIDAEAVPPDQEALGPEDMLWPVCHYTLQHHFVRPVRAARQCLKNCTAVQSLSSP